MTKLSVLDLVPIAQGFSIGEAIFRSIDLAAHVERLGFERFWVAEHHGIQGIASAATSLLIEKIADGTSTIRVGAGGIMLPNHAPLVIAEQFGTLDAMYPGRIDLGLGRAPGSDQRVMHAMRRNLAGDVDGFPRDVMELQSYFADDGRTGIVATPGAGADIRLYILGSSLYGAQMAAAMGLPFAFASHFAPQMLDEAFYIYRRDFRPSAMLERPYAMAGFNVFAADTDEEAEYQATSMMQSFVALRTSQPIQLPPPVRGYRETLPPQAAAMLAQVFEASAIGSPETVKARMAAFVQRTGADELILSGATFDPEARKKGLTIAAGVMAAGSQIA